MTSAAHSQDADREIAVSRLVEGPPSLVFEAFSDPSHLARWWGPNGFSLTTKTFDFSPGGIWEFVMHGPDGTDYPNWIQFHEISSPTRIDLIHGQRADDPEAFTSTFTFTGSENRTEVTLRSVFPSKELRDRAVAEYHAVEGANQTLGRLADFVTSLAGESERSA